MTANNSLTTMPLVSVIVPVYNIRKYIDRCLSSLKNQTLKEIEIIVIDDGSTDGSGEICDRYAETDTRFVVVHKTNEGLSAARNDGIVTARANYLLFVDGDDWVEPCFCEKPYGVFTNEAVDVVVFQHFHHRRITNHKNKFPKKGVIPKKDIFEKYWHFISDFTWNKMYRRRLFDTILFPVGHLCEDVAVTSKVLYKANSVFLLNECLYHYRDYRPGSISNNRTNSFYVDLFNYKIVRINDLKRWGYDYTDDEINLAFSYLIIIGDHTKFSQWCKRVLENQKDFPQGYSWKRKVMFSLYNKSRCVSFCVHFDWKTDKKGKAVYFKKSK